MDSWSCPSLYDNCTSVSTGPGLGPEHECPLQRGPGHLALQQIAYFLADQILLTQRGCIVHSLQINITQAMTACPQSPALRTFVTESIKMFKMCRMELNSPSSICSHLFLVTCNRLSNASHNWSKHKGQSPVRQTVQLYLYVNVDVLDISIEKVNGIHKYNI